MSPVRNCLCSSGMAILLAVLAGQGIAQDYPNRPIRVIVPSSAGSNVDSIARVLAAEMAKDLRQPVVVEAKPGANQQIGLEMVARQSPPDGYTIGVAGVDAVALLPLLAKELRFDPLKDLVPILGIAEARYVLAGPAARPWSTFQDLVAYAKAHPGKLNYGSSAYQVRIPVLVLMERLGLDMVHVPFAGGGTQFDQALANGTVDLGVTGEAIAARLGARVRVFAVTGEQRSAAIPDVPTFAELGFREIRGPGYAVIVRAGTPPAVVRRLATAASTALERPEVRGPLERMLLRVTHDTRDVAQAKLAELGRFYAELAQKAGLKAE